jgi:hypothetical protein
MQHNTIEERTMGLLPSLKDLEIELPDCTGLIREGEFLMATVSEQLPILVDAVVRFLDSKTEANDA